ncbi:MAG: energy transducer TonB [Flavobacterium sp.]|nr:energy transducer TonB [Flavobacterium sp.]
MVVPIGYIVSKIEKFENSDASNRRKSIVLSALLYGLMLLILFFIRFWPPSNLAELAGGGGGGGVSVNFGDTDAGMGNNLQNEEKVVKSQPKTVAVKEIPKEQDLIAEENSKDEGVVIPKNNIKKVKEVVIKETRPVVVNKPIETKPIIKKPSNDALSNILKGSKSGDGSTKTAGNQGNANGGLNNSDYGAGGSGGGSGGGNGQGNGIGTGQGSGSGTGGGSGSGNGKGSGAGYSLGNRKALSKPSPAYNCDEVGKVVVQITVDKNGKTINAIPGIKGTTNTAKCLLDQAKIAAMNTKWDASEEAPDQQVGKIEYNFKLN